MSSNTYFRKPDDTWHVYKTTDPKVRRQLIKQGWYKTRRDFLDGFFPRSAVASLAKKPDGLYRFWLTMDEFRQEEPTA